MIRKLTAAAALAAVCLFLSSCRVIGATPEDLMVAPYPTGELREIRTALQMHAKKGEKITPVYPKTGNTRSSFLRRDFDGSGRQLVFAFYSLEADPNTHLNILCREDDGWKLIFDYSSTAGKLQNIEFADLDGDGSDEIITSWSLFGSLERQLNIFTMKNDMLSAVFSDPYAGFVLADLNGDDRQELVVIARELAVTNREPGVFKASAQIYKLQNGTMISIGNVPLDGNTTDYAKISVGPGTGDAQGVYVDAYKGEGMITDVILMEKGIPRSAFMTNAQGAANTETYRPVQLVSLDADGDGHIEIPALMELPGYEDKKSEEKAYLTEWRRFDGSGFTLSFASVINMTDGYYLKYPENWIGSVTVMRDNENRTRTFKIWDKEAREMGDTLLQLRVFSEEGWKSADKGWIRLRTKLGFIYAARLYEHPSLAITESQLREAFRFLD